jgi:hypothetical protein
MKIMNTVLASLVLSTILIGSACGTTDGSQTASVRDGETDGQPGASATPVPPPPPPYPYPNPYPIPQGHVEVVELGSCLLIPTFDAADIQRDDNYPAPDRIYYDLSTRGLTVVRTTSFDGYGHVVYTETRNKCQAQPKHFEIMSNVGNEAFLAKKIRYYLKTEEINRCTPELKCF